MARPQNFDETQVLNTAMQLFWTQGYGATSMAQLLCAAELKPGSFYNAFASKKAIFVRALQHYNETVVSVRIEEYLNGPADPVSGVEDFFCSAAESNPTDNIIGCLLTNTATEFGDRDEEIEAVVWAGMRKIQLSLKRRILEAQSSGTVTTAMSAEALSLHLLSCYQGMSVIGELTQDIAKGRRIARSAVQILRIAK